MGLLVWVSCHSPEHPAFCHDLSAVVVCLNSIYMLPLQISDADMEFITKYVDADNDGRMSLRVRHPISRHTPLHKV